jgi:hypothetical protein
MLQTTTLGENVFQFAGFVVCGTLYETGVVLGSLFESHFKYGFKEIHNKCTKYNICEPS